MAWLNYEVMAFYLNIIAMGVFLLLSSCKKFRSIRDRIGLGIGQRKTYDYLDYCKDDIHWFCMWFTSFSLCIFSITMRNNDHEGIQLSAGVKFTRHFLEIVLLRQLFFSTRFEMKSYIKLIIYTILAINLCMVKLFMDLEDQYSIWWGPVFLFDVVLHFYIFIQMGIEYSFWDKKKLEWEKDIVFTQRFNENENGPSEEQNIRNTVEIQINQGMMIPSKKQEMLLKNSSVNESLVEGSEDQEVPIVKIMKLTANMYTISYTAFMKANKEKYRMKQADQVEIFFKALFMFIVQCTFALTVLLYEKFNFGYKDNKNSTPVYFCLFFVSLILHWQCLPESRNGIYMMKYALCKPKEFSQPAVAFLLGFMNSTGIMLAQTCSLLRIIDQSSPTGVITKFVGFALIVAVPKLIVGTIQEGLEVQKSVGKLVLSESRKKAIAGGIDMPAGSLLNLIYCCYKWFWVSCYFYFFPFLVILAPVIKVTYLYRTEEEIA